VQKYNHLLSAVKEHDGTKVVFREKERGGSLAVPNVTSYRRQSRRAKNNNHIYVVIVST
jgi:hypothetical protein